MDKLNAINVNSLDTNEIYKCYCMVKESGRLDAFMHGDNSHGAFVDFCYNSWIYIPTVNGVNAGFTMFNSHKGKSAFFHFVMFKGFEKHTVNLGRIIFNSVFKDKALLTIQGFVPKCYRHVFPILEGIGMKAYFDLKESCMIKGKLRTGVYSAITREHFYRQKEV